jgi:hypothetical protein
MNIIVDNMQCIMLVAGLRTLTTLQGVFAPRAALRAFFGESIDSPSPELVVRNWAALIGGGDAMLIYAAFNPQWRHAGADL